ncbi:MAG TPA: hypothetical protein VKS79_08720 [Gemmataceae bacterium]|nr:hypothetical protein [Gemmataceae bacterium]
MRRSLTISWLFLVVPLALADDKSQPRQYENHLTPIADPKPLLADHPEFVEPVRESSRFEAPILIDDPKADLSVRGWRFSYNARGIIEIPNRFRAEHTAIIVVHPWGIDDGQGWRTPEPAGVAFAGYTQKNQLPLDQMKKVLNPFLQSLRGKVGVIGYSLPGTEDPIRKKMYRSVHGQPTAAERAEGAKELTAKLNSFSYKAQPVPQTLSVAQDRPALDYFRQFPGLDATEKFNGAGFWELPIPVAKPLEVDPADVIFYDGEGYAAIRDFLKKQGIRHILLTGFHADMCVCSTAAGYKNLRQDFDVFLVGDVTQATFPACESPRQATTAAVCFASLDLFITQVSWVKHDGQK